MTPQKNNIRPLNWNVTTNGHYKTATPDFTAEELELFQQEQELENRRQALETQRRESEAKIKQGKMAEYERLKKLALGWRKQAGQESDKEVSAEKLLWAEEADAQVQQLAIELGLIEKADSEPKINPLLNTNYALAIIGLVFMVCVVVTKLVGNWTMTNYPNETTAMIMANTPLRIMLSFTVVFLSFLVAVLIKRLFLTPLYRLWHSHIPTARTFQDIVNDAPAWAVLFAVLFSFYGVMELFVRIFISLFA